MEIHQPRRMPGSGPAGRFLTYTQPMVWLPVLLLLASTDVGQIKTLIEQGKLNEAEAALAQSGAQDAEAQRLRGVIAYRRHDYQRAVEKLQAVLPLLEAGGAESRETVLLLGQSYYLSGRPAEAASTLEKLPRSVRTSEVWFMLGRAQLITNQVPEAVESFAALFGVAPGSAATHLVTARMMMKEQQEDQAAVEAGRALALDARIADAHLLIGEVHLFRGRVDEAIRELNAELANAPGSSNAFYRLGDAQARKENWPLATAALQKSIWLNPFFSAPYILLGKAYLKTGDAANAEGVLRTAIKMDPQNSSAHYLLGRSLVAQGRTEEGQKMLEKSRSLRPDDQP